MAAARFPWRDAVWFACAAVGAVHIARWSAAQLSAASRDLTASLRRYAARRDALARATTPRRTA